MAGPKKSKEPLSPSKRRALRIQKEDIASGETAAAKAFMTRNLPYTGDIHGKSRITKKKKKMEIKSNISSRALHEKMYPSGPVTEEFAKIIKKKNKNYSNQ